MGLNWDKKCGLYIYGRKMVNLRFADYIVFFANSNGELQETVNELIKLNTDGRQIKD
jgi:hypothetical protein